MTEILPKKLVLRKLALFGASVNGQRLILSVCLIFVAVGSFGLGRLATLQEQKKGLVIYEPTATKQVAIAVPKSANNTPSMQIQSSSVHNFVVSKNGTKYYPAGCKSASRIKLENEVWFETASAAVAAGYTLAAACAAK